MKNWKCNDDDNDDNSNSSSKKYSIHMRFTHSKIQKMIRDVEIKIMMQTDEW